MSGTIKNCYSPSGMSYWAGRSYAHLKDCPKCRYGTLDFEKDSEGKIQLCIDCGQRYVKRNGVWVTE